jgi:putative NADH-flavin reductase
LGRDRVRARCGEGSRVSRRRDAAGDVLGDPAVLASAVAGQDAVISTLGTGQSFKPHGLIARAASAIVAAMEREGARRLVFTSAFGVGPTGAEAPLLPRLFFATLLRDVYADKEAGEVAIRGSSLDWTIVYPVGLTNGPKTGKYRVGEHLHLSGFPRISRADLAEALLKQIDDPTSVRKGVLVAP